MTDAVATEPSTEADAHHEPDADHHEHASDFLYIKIAIFLAVLTGMEVAYPYIVEDGPGLMWPLLVMMAIKFFVIGSYFMHLKFDSKVLTRLFYTGLILAVGVYVIALLTFGTFWD
ncbi:MAG: cytochrome C oxidase subunit IV family protein [Iamia sp.]